MAHYQGHFQYQDEYYRLEEPASWTHDEGWKLFSVAVQRKWLTRTYRRWVTNDSGEPSRSGRRLGGQGYLGDGGGGIGGGGSGDDERPELRKNDVEGNKSVQAPADAKEVAEGENQIAHAPTDARGPSMAKTQPANPRRMRRLPLRAKHIKVALNTKTPWPTQTRTAMHRRHGSAKVKDDMRNQQGVNPFTKELCIFTATCIVAARRHKIIDLGRHDLGSQPR